MNHEKERNVSAEQISEIRNYLLFREGNMKPQQMDGGKEADAATTTTTITMNGTHSPKQLLPNRMFSSINSRRKNYTPRRRRQVFITIDDKGANSDHCCFSNTRSVDVGHDFYTKKIAPGQGLEPMDQPVEQKLRCDQEASQIVHDANLALGDRSVKNAHLNDLIASLTSLMLQVKNLASGDLNSYGFQSLNESLQEIKAKIDPSNYTCFQNNVEVHVAHIQSGMTQMGNLHAFSETCALPF